MAYRADEIVTRGAEGAHDGGHWAERYPALAAHCGGLVLLLQACALTPSPTIEGVGVGTKATRIPAHAVLVVSHLEERRFDKSFSQPTGITYVVRMNVGTASVNLFREGLVKVFEKVDVRSTEGSIPPEALVLVPRIRSMDADAAESMRVPSATIEYSLEVRTPDGKELVATTASGTGTYRLGVPSEVASLVFVLGTLGISRGIEINLRFSEAFGLAMSAAFEKLMRTLREAEPLTAYLQSEAEKRTLPADLAIAAVRFDDTRSLFPNNRLDAGEEAELVLTVRNQGRGSGYGVVLAVSGDQPQVVLPGPSELGEIPPGQSREVRLPVKAGLELPEGLANLLVEGRERRGYDARKAKLVIPTMRLERPSLSIAGSEINDGTTGLARGNGNGIPENGETIELLVFIRNAGPGPAVGATLTLSAMERGVEAVQKEASLGRILPNQTARGTVAFAIPRTHAGGTLTLDVRASDGRGEVVAAARKQVELAVTARAPVLMAATRVISAEPVTNDQPVEIVVTPRNTGGLDAEGVSVRISTPNPDVRVGRSQAEIGPLKAGMEGLPQRFEITIPRAFVHDRLALSIELSQREFPGKTELLDLPVKIRRPVLTSSFAMGGRRGPQAIEQNETVDLDVRIVNAGDLSAESLQARLDVTTPGVEIQGPRSVDVGRLAPNEQHRVQFKLRTMRSAPPGELRLSLTIAQADFPPLTEVLRVQVHPEQALETRVSGSAPPPPLPQARVTRPVIALVSPGHGESFHREQVDLRGTIVDDRGIDRVSVTVNGKPVPDAAIRQGLRRLPSAGNVPRDVADLHIPLALERGSNTVVVTVYNVDNEQERVTRTVNRLEDVGRVGSSQPEFVAVADVDHYIRSQPAISSNPKHWAVIIGIQQYRKAPEVRFARHDAFAIREYATKLLGVPQDQLFLLLDDQATKSEIQVVLEDRLQQRVQAGDTVYVYYAGHGIPEVKDGTPYLLPADGDPQSLRFSAYSLNEFYVALSRLRASRVMVFLDACFSGLSGRQEQPQMLLAGARPGVLVVKDPVLAASNLVSLAAAGNDQVSNAYPEQAHGLFTYFLLKGLSGSADRNSDGIVQLSELASFVKDEVSQASRRLFGQTLQQTPVVRPSLDASRDAVLRGK